MTVTQLHNKYLELLKKEEKENKAILPDKANVAYKINSDARVALLRVVVKDIHGAVQGE